MKKVAQIFSGGWKSCLYSSKRIIERLTEILELTQLDIVIIGWNPNTSFYKEIVDFLHSKSILAYLWLPVFSEIGELGDTDKSFDIFGNKTEIFKLQDGESFEFICPTSTKNHQLLFSVYESHFSDCGFDGVFLDKIRSQSFISGASDILSCCCENCKELYSENGVNLSELKSQLEQNNISSVFEIDEFDKNGLFLFKNKNLVAFFDAKQRIFTKSIKTVAQHFNELGLEVAFDVFAPSFAPLVGQDIAALAEFSSFVKPMMYRKTIAPAGIKFEYDCMKKALGLSAGFEKANALEQLPMNKSLFINQLIYLEKQADKKIYAGIEFNYREDIAQTDKEYIEESLEALNSVGCSGIVLSWDVMLAPNQHIELLGHGGN